MKKVNQNLAKFEGKKVTLAQTKHLKGGGGITVIVQPRSEESNGN